MTLQAGFHWRKSRSRSRSRIRKSASDLVKIEIGVVSGVISSTESESEESERFHFLPIPLLTPTAYDPVKTRLSESQAEAEGKRKNHPITKRGFRLRLRQSSYRWIISIRVVRNRKKMELF